MATNTSIATLLETNFSDINDKTCYGFYDWFCKDKSLKNKSKTLISRLKGILKNNNKFDTTKTYVFFKNNCCSKLYDDFRICDIESGNVLFTVVPSDPHENGKSSVWSYENDFDEAIVVGSWNDVKAYFR